MPYNANYGFTEDFKMGMNGRYYDPDRLNMLMKYWNEYRDHVGFLSMETNQGYFRGVFERPLNVFNTQMVRHDSIENALEAMRKPRLVYSEKNDSYTFLKHSVRAMEVGLPYLYGTETPVYLIPRQQYSHRRDRLIEMMTIQRGVDSKLSFYIGDESGKLVHVNIPGQEYNRREPLGYLPHSEKRWMQPEPYALDHTLYFVKQKESYIAKYLSGDKFTRNRCHLSDYDSNVSLTRMCSTKHLEPQGMQKILAELPTVGGRTMLDYIHASKGLFDKPIRSKHQGTRKRNAKRKGPSRG